MTDETGQGTEPLNIAPASPVVDDGDKRVLVDWEREIDEKFLIDTKLVTVGSIISDRDGHKAHISTVSEGWYKGLHVAVKKVSGRSTLGPDLETIKMCQREIAILSQVNHNNVVKFIGASVDNMTIITEFMMGGSLKKYLKELHPPTCLDLQTVVRFAYDIARAMEYLHAKGVIHRHLKPSNLLLSEDQKHLKVADFGLAGKEYGTESLKRVEKKYYTREADVHSFATVLWELIKKCQPFKGMSNFQAPDAVAMPSLENFPECIIPFMQCCWLDNPVIRPEFTEIIAFLSKFLDKLLAEQASSSQNDAILDTLQPEQPASSQNGPVLDTLQPEQASSLQNDAVLDTLLAA